MNSCAPSASGEALDMPQYGPGVANCLLQQLLGSWLALGSGSHTLFLQDGEHDHQQARPQRPETSLHQLCKQTVSGKNSLSCETAAGNEALHRLHASCWQRNTFKLFPCHDGLSSTCVRGFICYQIMRLKLYLVIYIKTSPLSRTLGFSPRNLSEQVPFLSYALSVQWVWVISKPKPTRCREISLLWGRSKKYSRVGMLQSTLFWSAGKVPTHHPQRCGGILESC